MDFSWSVPLQLSLKWNLTALIGHTGENKTGCILLISKTSTTLQQTVIVKGKQLIYNLKSSSLLISFLGK